MRIVRGTARDIWEGGPAWRGLEGAVVQSLREQIATHKGGEEEAQRQVEQLSREAKSLKAQLQHLEASTAQQLEAKDRAMASVRQSAELQVSQRETHHGSR